MGVGITTVEIVVADRAADRPGLGDIEVRAQVVIEVVLIGIVVFQSDENAAWRVAGKEVVEVLRESHAALRSACLPPQCLARSRLVPELAQRPFLLDRARKRHCCGPVSPCLFGKMRHHRRNQFHQDIHTIIADLSIMIKPTLTILDGSKILMRNGPTGGDPAYVKPWDVIVAGTDQVAMDAWAFVNLLQRDESKLPHYLNLAEKIGGGKIDASNRILEVS